MWRCGGLVNKMAEASRDSEDAAVLSSSRALREFAVPGALHPAAHPQHGILLHERPHIGEVGMSGWVTPDAGLTHIVAMPLNDDTVIAVHPDDWETRYRELLKITNRLLAEMYGEGGK